MECVKHGGQCVALKSHKHVGMCGGRLALQILKSLVSNGWAKENSQA